MTTTTQDQFCWQLRDSTDFLQCWPVAWAGRERLPEGVTAIVGLLRGTGSKACQAVRFDRNNWSADSAAAWWRQHERRFARCWRWR